MRILNLNDLPIYEDDSKNFEDTVLNALGKKVPLAGAVFSYRSLRGVDFSGANLKDAQFEHAFLSHSKFIGANLSGANFEYAHCKKASFKDANMNNADFRFANLCEADFRPLETTGLEINTNGPMDLRMNTIFDYCLPLDFPLIKFKGSFLEDEYLEKEPIRIFGLRWPVLITEKYLKIGCKRFTHEQWKEFSNNEVRTFSPEALSFWSTYRNMLLEMAIEHGGK